MDDLYKVFVLADPLLSTLHAHSQWIDLAFVDRSSIIEFSQETLKALNHAALNCNSFLFPFVPCVLKLLKDYCLYICTSPNTSYPWWVPNNLLFRDV